MIKIWKVTAEVNMDASSHKSMIVTANTKKKAIKIAQEKLKSDGAFCSFIENIEEIEGD